YNPKNDQLRQILTDYIKAQTGGRQDLIDRLIPDYAPMCRRPVVDNGWYQALTRDNVELVTDGIARFTPNGIETEDGKLREVDLHRQGAHGDDRGRLPVGRGHRAGARPLQRRARPGGGGHGPDARQRFVLEELLHQRARPAADELALRVAEVPRHVRRARLGR